MDDTSSAQDVPLPEGAQRFDRRSISAGRLAGAIRAAVLSGLGLVGLIVRLLTGGADTGAVAVGVAWLVGTVALLGWALAWPTVAWSHAWYRLDERGVTVQRGVVWQTQTFVPRSRIQHTDVARGPIERLFGLAKLIVHTAGTVHASVALPGLAVEDARRLRDALSRVGDDDAV